MDKNKLELDIKAAEQELLRLKEELNEDTANSQHQDAASAEEEELSAQEALREVATWENENAKLNNEAVEMLQAQLRDTTEINEELEFHINLLDRVEADRELLNGGTVEHVLRRIARWRRNMQRVNARINHFLEDIFKELPEEEGYISIESLVNELMNKLEASPSDPYMETSEDMYPPHLVTLEKAGIISFRRSGNKQFVRLLDLGPDRESMRLPPVNEEENMDESGSTQTQQSSSPS